MRDYSSALGWGSPSITRWASQAIYGLLSELHLDDLASRFAALEQKCLNQLAEERIGSANVLHARTIELRYAGTDQALSLEASNLESLELQFSELHRQRFGYQRQGKTIEVVALRVESSATSTRTLDPILSRVIDLPALPTLRSQGLFSKGEWHTGWVIERPSLGWGNRLAGPGIVLSPGNTTVVDVGWSLEVLSDHTLKLSSEFDANSPSPGEFEASRRSSTPAAGEIVPNPQKGSEKIGRLDPMLREVLAQRLAAIADSMGIVLEQTAISVNVKERRDYSCGGFCNQRRSHCECSPCSGSSRGDERNSEKTCSTFPVDAAGGLLHHQ